MSATQQRERAIQAVRTDFHSALQQARDVSDAWYRAQALAWVARFAPTGDVEKVANEALKAAEGAKDAYQQVAAATWAVRALVEREHSGKAAEAARKLLSRSSEISHPVSRLSALSLLWQAVWPLDRRVRREVLQALLTACESASSWQAGRTLRDVALMMAAEDAEEARRIIGQMPDGRYRRQAQKRLEAGQALSPRPYFW